MPPYTQGFIDHWDALQHFEEHCALLGADTADAYVAMADRFLGAPLGQLVGVEECHRPGVDPAWVRYYI
jgi:hypothetical protein